MLVSSTARQLYLRVGVRVGNRDVKNGRLIGGLFSVSLGAAAPHPLFLQEPGVAEASELVASWGRVARISTFRLKSALTSIRLFCSSTRIWS